MASRIHDVLVIGAGPGGSAAAFYLARAGLDVLQIERCRFPRDKTCGDALTPAATSILADMGVLEQVRAAGTAVTGCSIFAPNRSSTRVSVRGGIALGVRRLLLDEILVRAAADAGASFESSVEAAAIEQDGGLVRVRAFRDSSVLDLRARVAVLATGAAVRLPLAAGLLTGRPRFMVAGRTYLRGANLDALWEIHFDGVALPGYGWIAPVGDGLVNFGVGYLPGPRRAPIPASVQAFAASSGLRERLAGTSVAGHVKSYPLRSDFTSARTQIGRIFAVGEAAGLVNPLTGEGVGYALESGRLAADHILETFNRGEFSTAQSAAYDKRLRERYQAFFRLCETLRSTTRFRLALDLLVALAERRRDLKDSFAEMLLGPDAVSVFAAGERQDPASARIAALMQRRE